MGGFWRRGLALVLLHAALFVWAAWAWIEGPFGGEGVVDGAEVLSLARTGSAGPFETKSPLYAALLGPLLGIGFHAAWTVALLGLASSVVLLCTVLACARRIGGERAAFAAGALYTLSGSVYAFGVQPLETLVAALLLAGGTALELEDRGPGRRLLAGVLLGAAPFARIDLLLPAGLLLARAALRRSPAALGGAGAALALCLAFGARSIPEGGALNLRLGNDPARTGFTDLRPGPAYDRLRLDAVFAQDADGPLGSTDREHLRLLARAIAADPIGFLRVLARKAYLFLQRTEIVASADFRHGLERFGPARLLLSSWALVLPLALIGLARRPPPTLALALLGVLLANVLLVAAARYRFPALPLACVAAGLALARRPTRGELGLGLAAAVLCAGPNLAGRRLVTPGDGLVQQAHLLLAAEADPARAVTLLERALELGTDPRAAYLLGLAHERDARARPPGDPGGEELWSAADRAYARALELDALYPEAAENRVALALRRGELERARELAREYAHLPHAGQVHLNLAQLLPPGSEERRSAERLGHGILALRAHAQGSPRALDHAREAARLGSRDARVLGLARPTPQRR